MVSPNHINYWNYLETVQADRNREALQKEMNRSNIDLNKTQAIVNAAITHKLGAEYYKTKAETSSVLANIGFKERETTVKEKELLFKINSFAENLKKEYYDIDINKEVAKEKLKFAYEELAQELGIHTDKMNLEQQKLFKSYVDTAADLVGTILTNKSKEKVAEDKNEADKGLDGGDIAKIVSTLVGLAKFIPVA